MSSGGCGKPGHVTAGSGYEYPPEVKSILDRCEANVVSFSNKDVSTLLVEIDRLAEQTASLKAEVEAIHDDYKDLGSHIIPDAEREEQLREALQNYYDECPCRHGAERERCDFCKAAEVALKAQKAPH